VVDSRAVEWRDKSVLIKGVEISFSELSDLYWEMLKRLHEKKKAPPMERKEPELPWFEN